ncbi:Glycosyltransferase-like 1B [Gamsiella multidivaricata]|nr:Glycosyltransferase-like 1B [Gamsiella multidivaricata]
MEVEESILSAIDAISQACSKEHWTTEPAIVHTIRPKRTFSNRDVTMIAQFSISRLDRFEHARVVWDGPISVVIFLATNLDIVELRKYFERPGKLALYDSTTLTIVKPNYSLGTHKRYPINHLRNVGIQTASTDYIYVIDADFVPTSKLYNFARTTLVPLLEKATHPVAYVVPCLAIKEDYKGRYPDTIKELQPLMKSGMAYITDPRSGHGPTFTSIFTNTALLGNSPAYEVCYESQWEPYYIVKRTIPHPYYDERFKNQGGDKQSHALLMNAIGFKFLVLRDHFMYHLDHPKLKWTGDGLDQAKQKDYTYFSDYAPALERIFGSNYRWPRGCSRPLVQSFKRDLQGIGTM